MSENLVENPPYNISIKTNKNEDLAENFNHFFSKLILSYEEVENMQYHARNGQVWEID